MVVTLHYTTKKFSFPTWNLVSIGMLSPRSSQNMLLRLQPAYQLPQREIDLFLKSEKFPRKP